MPPPEPRSRTVSPAFNSASAVGLPQPSDAFMAVSGTSPSWAESYRFEVIGSQQFSSADAPPQHELPVPDWTRSAACPYFSLTTSLISHSFAFLRSLPAQAHNRLWFDCLVT